MSTKEITNSEDVIDSRDVIERIAELRSTLESEFEEWQANRKLDDDARENESELTLALPSDVELEQWAAAIAADPDHLYQEEATEFHLLSLLAEDGASLSDWEDGVGLIRESHFEDYARELAEDIGSIKRDMGWPCNCIDWKEAADQLLMDYTSVDFDGVTYYAR